MKPPEWSWVEDDISWEWADEISALFESYLAKVVAFDAYCAERDAGEVDAVIEEGLWDGPGLL